MELSISWLLNLFNMTSVTLNYFLVIWIQQNVPNSSWISSAPFLETVITSNSPVLFYWEMTFRDHILDVRGGQYNQIDHCFLAFLIDRSKKCILCLEKKIWVYSNISKSNSWFCGFNFDFMFVSYFLYAENFVF